MKTICAWCLKLLNGNPGAKIVSHGICPCCAKQVRGQMKQSTGKNIFLLAEPK